MERFTIQVGTFEVNCSILDLNGKAWIVDPGSEAERIVATIKRKGMIPEAILLTHAHFDHICGIPGVLAEYPDIPVYVGDNDMNMFGHPFNQLQPEYPLIAKPTKLLPVTDLSGTVTVIPTPGHTPGGVCYYFPLEKLLLSGDTLFAGSVGRTDLPGGSMPTLLTSLSCLTKLPDDTLVIPGHGPYTTIAQEKACNPYLLH